jgi:hypothetical protein
MNMRTGATHRKQLEEKHQVDALLALMRNQFCLTDKHKDSFVWKKKQANIDLVPSKKSMS